MTVHPARRAADRSRLARLLAWWNSPPVQLVRGMVQIAIAVLLVYWAVNYQIDQARAARQAHEACMRTMTFGPELARAYEHYRILSPASLEKYRETIPTRCD